MLSLVLSTFVCVFDFVSPYQKVICNDPAAHARFVKSYRMMLHFYGMVLEEETGGCLS